MDPGSRAGMTNGIFIEVCRYLKLSRTIVGRRSGMTSGIFIEYRSQLDLFRAAVSTPPEKHQTPAVRTRLLALFEQVTQIDNCRVGT
jgi:hypothetical protein